MVRRRKAQRLSGQGSNLSLLSRLTEEIAARSDWDLADLSNLITDLALESTGAQCACLFLSEAGDELALKSLAGVHDHPSAQLLTGAGARLAAQVVAKGEPIVVREGNRSFFPSAGPQGRLKLRACLGLPLIIEGQVAGALLLYRSQPDPIPLQEQSLLFAYAHHASLVVENVLLHQEVGTRLNQVAAMFETTRDLTSDLDLEKTLQELLDRAGKLMDAPICSLRLLDEESGELILEASRGLSPEYISLAKVKLGEGLLGMVVERGVALSSRDITKDGRFKFREAAREQGLRSMLAVPLTVQGRTVGVLNVYSKTPRDFSPADEQLLLTLANQAGMAIAHARLDQQSREQARFLSEMMEEVSNWGQSSLQTIAHLLSRHLAQPGRTPQALQQAIAWIEDIASIHNLLSQQGWQAIDLKLNIHRISEIICQTHRRADQEILLNISGTRMMLPFGQASCLGCAVNELVHNALIHGLASRKTGTIGIGLTEGTKQAMVQVKDDGVGLPSGFDLSRDAGLGLQAVQEMVEKDLRGELCLATEEGTTAQIRFPK